MQSTPPYNDNQHTPPNTTPQHPQQSPYYPQYQQQQQWSNPYPPYQRNNYTPYPNNHRYPDPSFSNSTSTNTLPNINPYQYGYPYYPQYSLNGPGPGPGTLQSNGYFVEGDDDTTPGVSSGPSQSQSQSQVPQHQQQQPQQQQQHQSQPNGREPQFASISYPSISTPQNFYYPPNHPYAYGSGALYQPYYDYPLPPPPHSNGHQYSGTQPNGSGQGPSKGLNPAAQGYVPSRGSSNPYGTGSNGGYGGMNGTFAPVVVDGEKLKASLSASSSSGLGLTQLGGINGAIGNSGSVPPPTIVSLPPAPPPPPPASVPGVNGASEEKEEVHGDAGGGHTIGASASSSAHNLETRTGEDDNLEKKESTTPQAPDSPTASIHTETPSQSTTSTSHQQSNEVETPPTVFSPTTPATPATPATPSQLTFTGALLNNYTSPSRLSASLPNGQAVSTANGDGKASSDAPGSTSTNLPTASSSSSSPNVPPPTSSTPHGQVSKPKKKATKPTKIIIHLRSTRQTSSTTSENAYSKNLRVPSSLTSVTDEEEQVSQPQRRYLKSRRNGKGKSRAGGKVIWSTGEEGGRGGLVFYQFEDEYHPEEEVETPRAGRKELASEADLEVDRTGLVIPIPPNRQSTEPTEPTEPTSKPQSEPTPIQDEISSEKPAPHPTLPPAQLKPKSWAALLQKDSKPFSRTQSVPSHVFSRSDSPSGNAFATGSSSLQVSPSKSIISLPEIQTPISTLANGESSSSTPAVPVQTSATVTAKQTPKPINYAAAASAAVPPPSPLEDLLRLLIDGIKSPRETGPTGVVRGLINTGNMCFANTILQVLLYCPPFTELFHQLSTKLSADLGRKTPLLESMIIFLRESSSSSSSGSSVVPASASASASALTPAYSTPSASGPVNSTSNASAPGTSTPTSTHVKSNGVGYSSHLTSAGAEAFIPEYVYDAMKENKRFDSMRRGHQEDAEEYLGFFLDTLHEELLTLINQKQSSTRLNSSVGGSGDDWLEVGKKQKTNTVRVSTLKSSAITALFGGTLRSILHTPGSSKDSITLEPYQPLQLDIQHPQITNITDALRHLSEPEIVPGVMTPKGKVDATKQIFLETFPVVLILHLKRFVYDQGRGDVVKRHRLVGYGTELGVPGEIVSPARRGSTVKYRLFGVVYHHGSTASGGHYTVAVHRQDKSSWIHFDDETVSTVPVEDVVVSREEVESGKSGLIGGREKCAYLLFYQRVR